MPILFLCFFFFKSKNLKEFRTLYKICFYINEIAFHLKMYVYVFANVSTCDVSIEKFHE